MDPSGKYPTIAVLAGIRWVTEIEAWKRGWNFVSRVAAIVLLQKSDCPIKVENHSIYLLFFDRGVVSVDLKMGRLS